MDKWRGWHGTLSHTGRMLEVEHQDGGIAMGGLGGLFRKGKNTVLEPPPATVTLVVRSW